MVTVTHTALENRQRQQCIYVRSWWWTEERIRSTGNFPLLESVLYVSFSALTLLVMLQDGMALTNATVNNAANL